MDRYYAAPETTKNAYDDIIVIRRHYERPKDTYTESIIRIDMLAKTEYFSG